MKYGGKLTNKIPELRARLKMTQSELAKQAGVSRQTIISIEKYKYTPSLSLAFEISLALNTDLTSVFCYERYGDN